MTERKSEMIAWLLLSLGVLVVVLALVLTPRTKVKTTKASVGKRVAETEVNTAELLHDSNSEETHSLAITTLTPRSVAVGFFGFVRNMITPELWQRFERLLAPNTQLEVFICSPHLMKENDSDHVVNEAQLRQIFGKHKVHVQLYSYDASTFVQKSDELGYPDFNQVWQYYPFRIVSLHYGISQLSQMILRSPTHFDVHLLTRLDMLNRIDSFGDVIHRVQPYDAYVYRKTPPFHSHIEDRCMIVSPEATQRLALLYQDLKRIDTTDLAEFYSERMISKYLQLFPELKLHIQEGLQLQWEPYAQKYSDEFKSEMRQIIHLARQKTEKNQRPETNSDG